MDTALPQKFPFILDRNLAKANCTGNRVCTSCDIVVLARDLCVYFAPIHHFFLTLDATDILYLVYSNFCEKNDIKQ